MTTKQNLFRLDADRCFALVFGVACVSAAVVDNNVLAGIIGVIGTLNWWVRA